LFFLLLRMLCCSRISRSLHHKIDCNIVILVIILIGEEFILIAVSTVSNYALGAQHLDVRSHCILEALGDNLEIHGLILYLVVVFVRCLNFEIITLSSKLYKYWLYRLLTLWTFRAFHIRLRHRFRSETKSVWKFLVEMFYKNEAFLFLIRLCLWGG
jgi:hypothetical protein